MRSLTASMIRPMLFAIAGVAVFATVPPCDAAPPRPKSNLEIFQKLYSERQLEFTTELEELAVACDEKGLTDAADSLRSLKVSPDWTRLHLEALPVSVLPPVPVDLPEDERVWRVRLRSLQSEYGKNMYQLAQKVLKAGYPGFAYNLVRETAIHDPDHKMARKLLGYVRHNDDWVTPYAAEMLRKHHVWTEDFGWIRNSDVEVYRSGFRYVKEKKVTAEKEAEIRRDFRHAWEIRTDHFLIKTNHSREKALELGRALEDFYEMFFQTFAGFFNTPDKLQRLFNGTGPESKSAAKPYIVHCYRSRDEYIEKLKHRFPQIAVTNGIYLFPEPGQHSNATEDHIVHFYHDEEAKNESTLFHEATHQLFFESHPRDRWIGEKAHFWIVEGIACYMESFQRGVQGVSLGDPGYIRFQKARQNLLEDEFYIPLKEFQAMGMRDFQQHSQLVKNYTQASGLAHFFMHYDNGRYREALVAHLTQLYSFDKRLRNQSPGLDELTGVSTQELDREYAEFCRQTETEITEPASSASDTETSDQSSNRP